MDYLSAIYKKEDTFQKPTALLHFTHNDNLVNEGMSPVSNWSEIDKLINRPKGIFFWNAEQEKDVFCSGIHKIFVAIADLDADKLFAFPVAVSDAAEQVSRCSTAKIEYVDLFSQLSSVKAVSFNDYDGSFFAEWIYTGDIEATIITGE